MRRPVDGDTVMVTTDSAASLCESTTRKRNASARSSGTCGAEKVTSRPVCDESATGVPESCDQAKVIGSLSGSDDPAALKVTTSPVDAARSLPALATGGRLAGSAPTPKSSVHESSV